MAREEASSSFMLNVQAKPGTLQAAFIRRSVTALERIISNVPVKTLTEALAAPTDVGSLAQLLSRADVVGAAVTELDPLASLMARNVTHREALLRSAGGALSAEEAGRILGVTRQAVDKRRRANTLLAFREGSDWRYPACQFDQGDVIPGTADVVRGLGTGGSWPTLDFLLSPDTALKGKSPLQALRQGERDRVIRLVRVNRGDGFA